MRPQRNVLLKNHTTFRIGGPAKYLIIAKNAQNIIEAIKFARQKKIPHFILGGGSNLLVSDNGFDGLVIKIQNSKINPSFHLLRHPLRQLADGGQDSSSKFKKISVKAGVALGELVKYSVEQNLTGLEWAAGIPGTVGGAIRGNAGAFGGSILESVKEVKIINNKFQIISYKFQNLKSAYRDSIFKSNNNIIIEAEFQLKEGNRKKSEGMVKKNLEYREGRHPLEHPSAGCIFKNPKIGLSVGQLIEQCGLKGGKNGRAMVSEKHANFIVNLGGAKAKDVIKLIQLIKKEIRGKFNLDIEEEIGYVGFK